MSKPKPVLPKKTYLITRRCSQRQFLLKPSEMVNQIITFILAWACARYGVQLHAACIMSNHLHLVITDVRGELPEFMRHLVVSVAKCVNTLLGRGENVFSPGSYSRVELVDGDAVLKAIAYVLTNPVEAVLVPFGKQWPGLRLGPWTPGQTIGAQRPDVFFRPQGKVPTSATVQLSRPPVFADMSDASYCQMVTEAVEAREQDLRHKYAVEGRKFLGVKGILAQSVYDTPSSVAQRRGLNPTVKAGDKWRRAEALQRNKIWLQTYYEKLEAYRGGDTTVEFPAGTYWMHRYAGARRASPD